MNEDYFLVIQTIIEPEEWDREFRKGHIPSSDYKRFNYVYNPS